jgi:D-amino-acid dehydrogenase
MAELVGHDLSIPPARIDTLAEATKSLFPGSIATGDLQPWTGMRPATPRGEPLVGLAARGPRNLLLNTGHGALGFTLAFGTAQLVADALAEG